MAKLIRDARQARGWTQDDLARKIGVREHDIYRWEKGTEPSRMGLLRLHTILKLSISDLIEAFEQHDLVREAVRRGLSADYEPGDPS